MATITETSDPQLWTTLKSIYDQDEDQHYIQRSGTLYHVVQLTDGSIAFASHNNLDLIDSRSFVNSRPAKYNKLDKS